MSERTTRRRWLLALGTAGVAGLAGCADVESGGDGSEEAGGTETGTGGADGTETGTGGADDEGTEQVTSRLEVVSAVGTDIGGDAIGTVEITVKKAPGSGDIDLSATAAQFVHSSGSTDLTFGSTGGSGSAEAFGVGSIQDDDDSLRGESPTLDDPADRAQLRLDTGSIVPSAGGLEEGDTATVRLTTESGATTELRLVVPETLAGSDAVDIYEGSESGGGDDEESEDTDQVTNRLQVVSSIGTDISDSTIGKVEIVVKKSPGSGDIDLSATTMQFVHSSGSTDLTFGSTGGSGSATEFGVGSVQDDGETSLQGESPTLDDPADRAVLVLDTSAIVSGSGGLAEGDTATVQLNTRSGGNTELRLVVPETLSGSEAVNL